MMFGEFLANNGYIREGQIEEALLLQKYCREKIGRILVSIDALTLAQLNKALKDYLSLGSVKSVDKLIKKYSDDLTKKSLYGSSIVFDTGEYSMVYSESFNDELIRRLEKEGETPTSFRLISKSQWAVLVKRFFSGSKDLEIQKTISIDEYAYKKMFMDIISQAKEEKASDVHFQPIENGLRVRFRIIGDLKEVRVIDKRHSDGFLTEAKELSGLPLVVTGKPIGGEATFPSLGLKVRSNKMYGKNGDGLCLRLNDFDDKKFLSLEGMGLKSNELSLFKKALNYKNGVILVSGQTGSGKSSTVHSMVMSMDRDKKNIITLEDPIEHESDDMFQLIIDENKMNFNQGLRSILRHDPDVIIVGEIRDEETAEICFKAAATGHLVISTIHTNDALNVISRLQMLGVPNDIIGENLRLSIAQRLIKKVCPSCCVDEKRVLNDKKVTTKKPKMGGCNYEGCIDGFLDRRQVILEMINQENITNYLRTGELTEYKTLKEVAIEYAMEGVISLDNAIVVA